LVDIDTLVKAKAEHYAVNVIHYAKTVQCESRGNLEAVGDHGAAYGPLQFHAQTFVWMKNKAIKEGEPFENFQYKNPEDQITLGAWAFSKGLESNWSCFRIEKAKGWR
jgi:hypothetical protein